MQDNGECTVILGLNTYILGSLHHNYNFLFWGANFAFVFDGGTWRLMISRTRLRGIGLIIQTQDLVLRFEDNCGGVCPLARATIST